MHQLEQLDVDFIAYQDEIGVEKTQVEESAGWLLENLYKLHKKAAQVPSFGQMSKFFVLKERFTTAPCYQLLPNALFNNSRLCRLM